MVSISLANGSDAEVKTREKLLALLSRYNLSKWHFTDVVRIEQGVVSHSHPVLTLNTRHLDDDAILLANYIHEQIHWFLSEHEVETINAISEIRRTYKSVPVGFPEGARNEHSTYLHLIVCFLEFKALVELLGRTKAQEALKRRDLYLWIYATVSRDFEEIAKIVASHGLEL